MIRQIRNKVELTAALSLIWETFLQFEAPHFYNLKPLTILMKVLNHSGTLLKMKIL